jgi:phosphoribosylglycinamide formyltransferase-1
MKNVILITGSELRHEFLRMFLSHAAEFTLVKTYAESHDNNIVAQVDLQDDNTLRKIHLSLRCQTEKDFFELYCSQTEDFSNVTFLKKGDINSDRYVEEIKNLNPDLIIAYGCSIIKPALVEHFENRFINVHLGLSPYYRGSGTNFWPFMNNEPELVGVTFMHIDAGVDTGKIFHQIRPRIFPGDDVHKIGNRLIYDFAMLLPMIISRFDDLEEMEQIAVEKSSAKYYKNSDFSEASLVELNKNFSAGMVEKYIENKANRDAKYKIIQNPALA